MNKYTNVIIGGGFTGLLLAKQLNNQHNTLIITEDIGGLLGSFEQDGFTFDFGGHVYTTLDENVTSLMIRAKAILHPTRKAFWLSDKYGRVPFPVQNHLKHLIFEPSKKLPGKTLQDYAINQFGGVFYDEFFRPFNMRVWTANPARMSADWVKDRVATKEDQSNKTWGINSAFYYATGANILDVLLSDLPLVEIYKASFYEVDRTDQVVWFKRNNLIECVRYDRLFITHQKIGPTNDIIVFGVGLNRKLDDDFHWVYGDFKGPIHRITLLSRYYHDMAPDGKDSLLLEYPISSIERTPLMFNAHRSKEMIVQSFLHWAGIDINENDIETVALSRTSGYPTPMLGVRKLVESLKMRDFRYNIFRVGRWGSHGYFNLQHIFKDVEAACIQANMSKYYDPYITSSFYYGG